MPDTLIKSLVHDKALIWGRKVSTMEASSGSGQLSFMYWFQDCYNLRTMVYHELQGIRGEANILDGCPVGL